MDTAVVLSVWLLSLLSRADPCSPPPSLDVSVSPSYRAGEEITRVTFDDCDMKSTRLTSKDPSFSVRSDGETVVVAAAAAVEVGASGRTFPVLVEYGAGGQREMDVRLVCGAAPQKQQTRDGVLRRSKRRWSPPPLHILENDVGPYPRAIEEVQSDSAAKYNVYYTFSGPGFDQIPLGVFSLDRNTGTLSVHKPVDREQYPSFTLITKVFDRVTNQPTDDPLPITINVDDVNDNAPTFTDKLQMTVLEQSSVGAIVGKVNATDRDQAETLHVKIRYTLLDGLDKFAINPQTGVITTVTNTLDREVKDKYLVTVQIKDMDGAVNGLSNTATATITLGDINDNPPTFTEQSFEATVQENEREKLILRIPVKDKDLINTPNWISKFIITKGNENENFRIDTDPKTNDGLLYVTKPLNYEQTKKVDLEIMARNVAELSGTKAQWQKVPVGVNVTNIDEGPEFTAPTVRFTVKENTPNGTLIGTYTAVDPETKSSKGITYYKTADPGSWVKVDKNTGELKVANTMDRESHFVKDGTYTVNMKAVDASAKTGTGTVIIVVEDVNDNRPTVPTSELVLCEKEGQLGSVAVVAEDNDQHPFSSPFIFSLPASEKGKWAVARLNDTAATLSHVKELPTGIHIVPVNVNDLQGHGGTQSVKVRICQCKDGACLPKDWSASLGGLGVLALLLPLLLLLLLFLLLIFFCVTGREKLEFEDTGDSGGILLKSNTEAPGDEVDSSLITVPLGVDSGAKGSAVNAGWLGNKSSSTIGGQSTHENGMYKTGLTSHDIHDFYSSQYDNQYGTQQFGGGHFIDSGLDFDGRHIVQNSGFHHLWQTNGLYLQQKLGSLGTQDERYADDIMHGYTFEGAGSAAGSVGCCSEHGDKGDLNFLNTLGPKFKGLADVCKKT